MKDFIAIVATTPDGRIAKYQDFDTLEATEAHVQFVATTYPDAFAVANPGSGAMD